MKVFNRAFLLILGLAACASLTKQECLDGNWRQIGIEDGIAGRLPERLQDHAKACAEVGVMPDATAWESGRREGLKTYCTPASAYQVGRKGRRISAVCTPSQRQSMNAAYSHGQQYYDITQEIDELEREIASNRDEISALLKASPTDAPAEVFFIEAEIMRLNGRIHALERQRRAFSTWP